MAEPKTRVTKQTVEDYLSQLPDERVRAECATIGKMMEAATQATGEMYGASIVGYGRRMIRYAGGKDQEWMVIGYSPRKQNLTLYIPGGLEKREELLERLGAHACGKGCLYIKKLADVNIEVLEELIHTSVREESTQKAL
jgi:hypothetical protein